MAAYGRDADDEESGTDGESAARSTEEQNGNECSLIVRDLTRGRDVSLVAGAWWRVRELKEAISATHPETPDPQTFEIVRKGRTLVDEEGRIGEQMEGFDGNSGGAIVVHLVGDQGKGEADAVTEAYEAAYEAALAAMQLSEADIPRPNHNQPRFQLGNRQREAEEAEGLQHQLHQYMGQRVGENNNQNQNQRQVRVRVIRIDVKLVLKLAVGVFLLSQGGSRTRVLLLSLLAGVAYLAQAGHVANGAFPRALETAKEAAVQRLVRSARGARRGHPAAEAECFLIGFCCSLFPGFRLPPAATQDAGDDDDDDAFRRD